MREWKRKLIQVVSALLYNCNLTGFAKGEIYQGPIKKGCVPGLNCYSCPGAVGSCPLGSLQTALVSSKYRFPYFMLGLLLLFGVLLGRLVCGFLCPFGLLQELLYKIPTPKLKKNKITRILSYLKYVILVVFAVLIPIFLAMPGFCKFICPAGTLEAGIPLVLFNESLRETLGFLYGWKIGILILCLLSMIFIFRSFCRFICPLGAFYSLFAKIAFVRIQVDESACDKCGACTKSCNMDVKSVGDHECIGCGHCCNVCPHHAISYGICGKSITKQKTAEKE